MRFIARRRGHTGWNTVALAALAACTPASGATPQKKEHAMSTAEKQAIRPFRVDFPDEALADMKRRILAVRWPSKELVSDQSQGVQLATMQQLARAWTTDYD